MKLKNFLSLSDIRQMHYTLCQPGLQVGRECSASAHKTGDPDSSPAHC